MIVLPKDEETHLACVGQTLGSETEPFVFLGVNLSLVIVVAGPDSLLVLHSSASTVGLDRLLHGSPGSLQLIVLVLVVLLDVDVLSGELAAVGHHVSEGLVPGGGVGDTDGGLCFDPGVGEGHLAAGVEVVEAETLRGLRVR